MVGLLVSQEDHKVKGSITEGGGWPFGRMAGEFQRKQTIDEQTGTINVLTVDWLTTESWHNISVVMVPWALSLSLSLSLSRIYSSGADKNVFITDVTIIVDADTPFVPASNRWLIYMRRPCGK